MPEVHLTDKALPKLVGDGSKEVNYTEPCASAVMVPVHSFCATPRPLTVSNVDTVSAQSRT